ncbi:malonic semialdehyde reductase [Poriferisphaera corsica]|uniref:Malonic semialdehyde reductase n=1 Tax=Poriferisphaera corsica TaxID=2528020 RepID=A0A517YUG7_9BACT|nr:nitroreductase family protein [Poriferisphaera corsica]QDU33880.1 malonic semialdehyde reductase [Poriferisphaera corsica]
MEKPTENIYPIHSLISRRWSPRSFSEKSIEPKLLQSIFEAARWAASSYNEQPWRFIIATRDSPSAYQTALACLVEANQAWAQTAPVLILTLTSDHFSHNDNPNRCALHDLGLATSNLTLQALEYGIFAHHMAGIDANKIQVAYNIPDNYTPQTAIALGYPANPQSLPEEWMREAETSPRTRKSPTDLFFENTFNNPHSLFAN